MYLWSWTRSSGWVHIVCFRYVTVDMFPWLLIHDLEDFFCLVKEQCVLGLKGQR